jgi:hypothetical protein
MKRLALGLSISVALVSPVVFGQGQGQGVGNGARGVPALAAEPPMLGIHWARDAQPSGNAGANPNMTWHNGAIMLNSWVEPIYWGPSWDKPSFVGDKETGLESWYRGVSGSAYADTSDEYTGTNGQVTNVVTWGGSHVDLSSVPGSVSAVTTPTFNEVCKVIGGAAVANGYYPVYVDKKRGNAQFCAYHSYGTCNGVPVQFGFFFNVDGDAGCDPRDTSGLHSQGLAALANVTGHELSEARTDPRNGGWWDNSGAENADKCAWTFGTPLLSFTNGSQWKIQGNWSNGAYTGGSGYPNGSGQKGCLDGGNYK